MSKLKNFIVNFLLKYQDIIDENLPLIFRYNPQAIIISTVLSLSVAFLFYVHLISSANFSLNKFPDRVIGVAVINGIDAGARSMWYYEGIFATFLVFISSYAIISYFTKSSIKVKEPQILKKEQKNCKKQVDNFLYERMILKNLLLFTILSIIIFTVTKNQVFYSNFIILLFICFATIFVILIQIFFVERNKLIFEIFTHKCYLISTFLIPFQIFVFYWIVSDQKFGFDYGDFLFYFLIWIIVLMIIYAYQKIQHQSISNSFIIGTIPLHCYAFSIPLLNELQYSLSNFLEISPKIMAIYWFLVLLLLSVILMRFLHFQKKQTSQSKGVIFSIIFPLYLITFTIYRNYSHYKTITAYDLFHHGEIFVPVQQFFEFGKIPIFDFYAVHGVSDWYSQFFYGFINGYRMIEVGIWQSWITAIFGVLLLYFFLKRLFDPTFAVLLLFCIPVCSIFTGTIWDPFYYSIVLLAPLFLLFFIERPILIRLIGLCCSLIILLLWRLDFGIPAIFSVLLILGILFIRYPQMCITYYNLNLKKLSLYFSVLLLIILSCLTLLNQSIFEIITYYFKINSLEVYSQSYVEIIGNYKWFVPIFQYYICPLIGIFFLLYFIFVVFSRDSRQNLKNALLLAFVSVFSLLISLRGVERHCQIENYSTYLFLGLLCCLPCILPTLSQYWKKICFLCLVFIIVMIIPIGYYLPVPDVMNPFYELHHWNKNESRLIDDQNACKNITLFFKQEIGGNETYFSFTDNPLLHVFTHTRIVPYIVQNLLQTSDIIQNNIINDLSRDLKQGTLPYILFSGYWNGIDGVPYEIRNYRIAEFIYSNYQPSYIVDNYHIWSEKNKSINKTNYYLPFNKQIECHNVTSQIDDYLFITSNGKDPYCWNFVNLSPINNITITHGKMKIDYQCNKSDQLQIFYSKDNTSFSEKLSSWIQIENSTSEIKTVVISLPNISGNISNIRIDPPDNSRLMIKSINVYPNQIAIPNEEVIQKLDLKKLPYIWYEYDLKNKMCNLQSLYSMDTFILTNNSKSFYIPPNLDKSTGNYLLINASSKEPTQLKIWMDNYTNGEISCDILPNMNSIYAVRISMLYNWYVYNNITFSSDITTHINEVKILKGD